MITSSCYLFSNQVFKTLKVFKDSRFQMVLGAPGPNHLGHWRNKWDRHNNYFQWFVVGNIEIYEMTK